MQEKGLVTRFCSGGGGDCLADHINTHVETDAEKAAQTIVDKVNEKRKALVLPI